MSKTKKKRKPKLHIYHRYLGLAVALFVIILSITGMLLNHTEGLRLDQRSVSQRWLLDVYGISAPKPSAAWQAGGQWVSQFGERLYLDQTVLPQLRQQSLKGALAFQNMIVIATKQALALYTPAAELIDTLPAEGVQAIGLDKHQTVIIQTRAGQYSLDNAFTQLKPLAASQKHSVFVKPASLPESLLNEISQGYIADGLPLERVILDLHSGRLVGKMGVYLMDSAALMMILLTVSGVIVWIRRTRRKVKPKNRITRSASGR